MASTKSSVFSLLIIAGVTAISKILYGLRRIYEMFWHEIAFNNPRVRRSPFVPPPKDEIKLTFRQVFWVRMVRVVYLGIHIGAVFGLWYILSGQAKLQTIAWTFVLTVCAILGVTVGVHRLWSHRSFKATWQLRLILMVFQTLSHQYNIFAWARDHRVHHKFSDTDADPHNSKNGFYFCHIGWLMYLRHKDVNEKVKTVPVKDLEDDPIVRFQRIFYSPLWMLISHAIPTFVPYYYWNENFWVAYTTACFLRHVLSLHGTFFVNSVAHLYGMRPYDKNIQPVENLVPKISCFGEGWHNYHHVFPWDYRNSEYGTYTFLNFGRVFIDFFAKIGWAYDLKTVPAEMIEKRVKRTGDGSHPVWGWNDLPEVDKKQADIKYAKTTDVFEETVWGYGDENLSKADQKQKLISINNLSETHAAKVGRQR